MHSTFIRRSLLYSQRQQRFYTVRSYSALPRIVTPSFWKSLVPKPLRSHDPKAVTKKVPETKPWNPATFFIIIFLVIGSNAINLLAVKKDYISFSRQADAKIAALKEALERVQRGEDVDVKKLLGTGDKIAEKEWEDVIKELQEEGPPLTRAERRSGRKANAEEVQKAKSEQENIVRHEDKPEDWTQPKTGEQITRKAEFY